MLSLLRLSRSRNISNLILVRLLARDLKLSFQMLSADRGVRAIRLYRVYTVNNVQSMGRAVCIPDGAGHRCESQPVTDRLSVLDFRFQKLRRQFNKAHWERFDAFGAPVFGAPAAPASRWP